MTKKIKRLITWIAFNGFMAWCVWQGVFNHVEWPQNVLKFMVWLNFCLTILLFVGSAINAELRDKAQEQGLSVPVSVNLAYDLVLAGALAAAGWFCYGGLVIVQGLMQIGLHSSSDKKL